MKKKSIFTALAIAGALAFIPGCARETPMARSNEVVNEPWFVHGQQQQQPSQTMQQRPLTEERLLTNFDNLKGMKIQNSRGEELGSVDKLIVDIQLDKIAYAVVSTGGIWNLEGGKAVVPWNAFQLLPARDGGEQVLILNVAPEQLAIAPPGDIEQVLSAEMGRRIHQFYGVSPYWTETTR
jgi:sporulation protein YlmC with PRC-barrel domain